MVLVDTSVWVDFLRSGDTRLARLLEEAVVCMHSMVLGELACGHLKERKQLLSLWGSLSGLNEADHDEVMYFLEKNRLFGKGIGLVDLYLLASTALAGDVLLWTKDRRLQAIAKEMNMAYSPS